MRATHPLFLSCYKTLTTEFVLLGLRENRSRGILVLSVGEMPDELRREQHDARSRSTQVSRRVSPGMAIPK